MTENEPRKIVFLIDEHSLQNNITLEAVVLAITRLLIYYNSFLKPNSIAWSFRFFSTSSYYPSSGTRAFQSISEASLKEIETQYQKRELANSSHSTNSSDAPITYIKRVLTESLVDFRWGATDSSSLPSQTYNQDEEEEKVEHYLHIITSCPYTESAMKEFFDPSLSFTDALTATKEAFGQFLNIYKAQHISLNLIDTNKSIACKPRTKGIDRCVRTQFESIMFLFGGQYLPIEMLVKKYSTYGYDFLSELTTHLPSTAFPKKKLDQQRLPVGPVWFGEFKTKSHQSLGDFSLYHAHNIKERDNNTFLYVQDIVIEGTLHRKQVLPAWIIKDQPQINPAFFLCCVNGDKWGFRNLLRQLHESQLMILAKLIPLDGFKRDGSSVKKVIIEPLTVNVASVQLVNTKNFPHLLKVDPEKSIEEYPIGCDVNDLIALDSLQSLSDTSKDSIDMEQPSFLKDLMMKKQRHGGDHDDIKSASSPTRYSIIVTSMDTPNTSIAETIDRERYTYYNNGDDDDDGRDFASEKKKKGLLMVKEEEDDDDDDEEEYEQEDDGDEDEMGVEEIIELPANVNAFGKSLKLLYIEVLYKNRYPMEETIKIIDAWIQHLINRNHSKEDIINQIYVYTLSNQDLNEKHANVIPQGWKQPTHQSTFEQICLFEWWEGVKSRPLSEEKDWSTTLKLKEAQLQVILYCFMARLLPDTTLRLRRDPADLAEKFFSQIAISHAIHHIDEFLHDKQDFDPVDFTDIAFMELLENNFSDLPELVLKFREAVDMDETDDEGIEIQKHKIPARTIPTWDELNASWAEKDKKNTSATMNTIPKAPSSVASSVSNFSRNNYNNDHKVPSAPKRQASNPIESFLKRTVVIDPKTKKKETDRTSEASRAADAKVHRSKINGEATMKRKHGFLKSARSPKRTKQSSRLFTEETGTVVLRRAITSPTTPRTRKSRMVRDWENNIFADFQEPCPSPSNSSVRRQSIEYSHYDNNQSPDLDQIEFSINAMSPTRSAGPKTPQSTPKRFKKIMTQGINGGRNHHYEESESMKIPITSLEVEEITPRTSMRRKRQMDVDQIRPSRNLTSLFEAMRDPSPDNSHGGSSQTSNSRFQSFWESDVPSISLPEED